MDEISKLHQELDFLDRAYANRKTKIIRMNKKSDVAPKLEAIIGEYLTLLQSEGQIQ